VKASGKNAISTLDFPANCDSEIFSPDVDGNVKSGARSPTIGVGALETADAVTVDLFAVRPGARLGVGAKAGPASCVALKLAASSEARKP
jgi:hypothetical protein